MRGCHIRPEACPEAVWPYSVECKARSGVTGWEAQEQDPSALGVAGPWQASLRLSPEGDAGHSVPVDLRHHNIWRQSRLRFQRQGRAGNTRRPGTGRRPRTDVGC